MCVAKDAATIAPMFAKRLSRGTLYSLGGVSLGMVVASHAGAAAAVPPSSPDVSQVANSATVRTKASGGQNELVVGYTRLGVLQAAVCASPGCALEPGLDLQLPSTLATQRNLTQLTVVDIGQGRSAVVARVPDKDASQVWQAVIVALPGQPSPKVVFKGVTGYTSGELGLRQGQQVQISEPVDESGMRRILVGDLHEDLTLCHREALLSPQLLDPQSLELRPAKVQRLSAKERERAEEIVAQPVLENHGEPSAVAGTSVATAPVMIGKDARLLRAVGASSAVGWPNALTDGDPETTWAENRGGAGRGEFVVMKALSDVPISAFDVLVRPTKKSVPNGVGAELIWLITTHEVFKVRFTNDPWKTPGVHYRIGLSHPVVTDCVALVTDSAYGDSPKAEVTFAELSARTEFEAASLENLMGALAGGGPRAEAAGSVLAGMGEPAFQAINAGFNELDEGGRRVALDVADHAPCELSTPVYIKALASNIEEQQKHALERIRRCGTKSQSLLVAAVETAEGPRLTRIIEALSQVSPAAAIDIIVNRLGKHSRETHSLRELLSRAVQSPSADDAIRGVLARGDLSNETAVSFLMALRGRETDFGEAVAEWIGKLTAASSDWQMRYRLVNAAAPVAPAHPGVRQWLSQVMTSDESPFVRKQAAAVVTLPQLFQPELLHALKDPEVRVREAAAQALSSRAGVFAKQALFERLRQDAWPLVRSAVADALAVQPPDTTIDKQLAESVSDSAPMVRSRAIDALGRRQAFAQAPAILEHFQSRDEQLRVRMSAARALGWLCYEKAVPALSDRALTLRDPVLDAEQRSLAGVSLAALSRIHPAHLEQLLKPILADKNTPPAVRRIVQSALDAKERCTQLH